MYTEFITGLKKCTFPIVLLYCISLDATQPIESEDLCDDIMCSNVYDPVCGEAIALNGARRVHKFHNICYLRLAQCKFSYAGIYRISDEICDIQSSTFLDFTRTMDTRRLVDFSIVGGHQACNHTCPTFCLDIYDPACAQIWARNMKTYVYRPMINHCHIDLYSCVVGVNVTIQPLIGKCYKNPTAINFMLNVASMKTLKLLDDPAPFQLKARRSNQQWDVSRVIKREIKHFIHHLRRGSQIDTMK